MADIFISYKSERRPAARHLSKVLEAYGYDVWYDYGLVAGEAYEPHIMAELSNAKAVIVLWCTRSVESDWVHKEALRAVELEKYLPCWIESAKLPERFAASDTINLTQWDGAPRSHVLDRLLADLARRIQRDPSMNFNRLREIDEDWRNYGAPTLSQFALGKPLTPENHAQALINDQLVKDLGEPPALISTNLREQWANAKTGDASAIFEIGWAYNMGISGVKKDLHKAVRLWMIASEMGNATAQANLGFMYGAGLGGLEPDKKEELRLYKEAAAKGDALGQANLGYMYDAGLAGLEKNEYEALRLYRQSAEQGNAVGMVNLGYMYENGLAGLPKDEFEAVRLYQLSAELNEPLALNNLGFFFEQGKGGLPQSDRDAVKYYRLAAERQDPLGRTNLALMYEKGRGGLERDLNEAVRLFRLAANQGNGFARKRLSELGYDL